MSDTQMVSMNVDPEVVESIIRKSIQTSLLAAMGSDSDKGAILDAIVMSSMKTKVDQNGKISQYSSDNKYDYLEWKVQSVIRGATARALEEFVESKHSTFKKAIKKSIEANSATIADGLVKAFAESAADQWRFKVDLTVDTNRD